VHDLQKLQRKKQLRTYVSFFLVYEVATLLEEDLQKKKKKSNDKALQQCQAN